MASFHSKLKSLGFSFGEFFESNKCFSSSNFATTEPCLQGFFNFFWHDKQKMYSDDVDSVDSVESGPLSSGSQRIIM